VPSNYIVTVVGTPQIGNGPREVFTRFAALERVNFAAIYIALKKKNLTRKVI
jgi:hypothetical protein